MAAAVEMAHHVVAVKDDDDNFAEDECTMDFGDEEDAKQQATMLSSTSRINGHMTLQQRHLLACKPVPGAEDFSRYLPDDDVDDVDRLRLYQTTDYDSQISPPPLIVDPTTTTRRYRKRNEQTSTSLSSPVTSLSARPQSPSPPPFRMSLNTSNSVDEGELRGTNSVNIAVVLAPTMSAARLNSSSDDAQFAGGTSSNGFRRKKSINVIRDLGRFLTRNPSKTRRSRPPEESSGTLHDFSFADSKMASEFLHRHGDQSPNNSSSQFEMTESDLGFTGRPGWWDVGTLSSSRSGFRSSNSSTVGSTLSKRNLKIGGGQGKYFMGFFQRRKSLSVPNLQTVGNDNYDSSSVLSTTSGSGGGDGNSTVSYSSNTPNAGQSSPTSSSMPPPLPPLRRPSRPKGRYKVDDGIERSQSSSRMADFWKKLRTGSSS